MRTYVYKLTSDRGGAPCVPEPLVGESGLLSLSICKPAIRRTARVGDRLLGLTSVALARAEGYPLGAVIYAARVTAVVEFGAYYAAESGFGGRPDCVYAVDAETGELRHAGRTRLHAEAGYLARDVGRAPGFRNARTLLCAEFRYFGRAAVVIPRRFSLLRQMAEALGQGHRVFEDGAAESTEMDGLFRALWRRETGWTPGVVEEEARGHAPRS